MIEEIGLIREVRTLLRERDEARTELDSEMDHSQDLAKRVERLLAQNRRLREALQWIVDEMNHKARRALEPKP